MVNVELSGQAANNDSGPFIWCAGRACLVRSSNHTDETDRRNQMNQIPATRRGMCDYKTWTHFLGAAMFIPGA
jgi:hypothetical protein